MSPDPQRNVRLSTQRTISQHWERGRKSLTETAQSAKYPEGGATRRYIAKVIADRLAVTV